MNDGGETGFRQDDISGTAGSVSRTFDSNTDVGTGKSGSIVRTITSHGAQMTEALETLDNLVFVFGEDTSETVCIQDHLVERSVLSTGSRSVLKNLRGVHVVAETKTTAGFLCDGELITSDHLDLDTESHSIVDGLLGILTRGIENGKETNEFEAVTLTLWIVTVDFLECDSESTKTTLSVLLDIGLEAGLDFVCLVARAKFDNDTGHTLGNPLELSRGLLAVCDLGTFVDRVEWLEVEKFDTGTGASRITDGVNNALIDGILVLGTGSIGGKEDNILCREGAVSADGVTVNGELVGGKGTRLVGAKNGDGSQFLDGGNTSNNSLVFGELLSTDGESDGQNSGHGNWNTTDQEDEDVVKTAAVLVAETCIEYENLREDENTNSDEAE